MRKIVSVSMPEDLEKNSKIDAKKRGFDSMSSYINHLLLAAREAIFEDELIKRSKRAKKDHKRGGLIKAKSLAEL
jgi:Arc/MetJ-type ribon-helix-helix transcriptional regulator